jgi:hypothetical protein
MGNRRNFLKIISIASVAAILPKISSTPQRLTIPLTTSNADMAFGVNGVERMRIYSNGNVSMACINPSSKLEINKTLNI